MSTWAVHMRRGDASAASCPLCRRPSGRGLSAHPSDLRLLAGENARRLGFFFWQDSETGKTDSIVNIDCGITFCPGGGKWRRRARREGARGDLCKGARTNKDRGFGAKNDVLEAGYWPFLVQTSLVFGAAIVACMESRKMSSAGVRSHHKQEGTMTRGEDILGLDTVPHSALY